MDRLISEQAVIESIEFFQMNPQHFDFVTLIDDIKEIPSAEPKTGHWIVHERPHGIRYLECPYCNIWYLNEHLIRNSFCPNCGAKMSEIPTGSNVDGIEG